MSEPTPNNPSDAPASSSAPPATPSATASTPAPKPKKIKQPGRWRRRIVFAILAVVAFMLIARLIVHFALPPVLERVAAAYDLDITYERQEVTLAAGDAGLWYLKITPKSGGEPLFTADYVRGNISTIELLKGRLDISRVEADGVNVFIERAEDGRIPALDKLLAPGPGEPVPTPVAASSNPEKIQLKSPLKIDAIRLHRAKATIRDKSVTPMFEGTVALDVRISDVRSYVRPTKFEIEIWSDPTLDSLRIAGVDNGAGATIDADATINLRGLRLRSVAPYLEPFGIRPVADTITMDMRGRMKADALPNPADGVKTSLVLSDIVARADGQDAVTVKQVEIDADALNGTAARIAKIMLEGIQVNAERTSGGQMKFAGIELIPATATRAGAAVESAPSTSKAPFKLSIADFSVRNAQATLIDNAVTPASKLAFVVNQVTSKDIVIDQANPDASFNISGKFAAPGIAEAIHLDGTIKPMAATKTAELSMVAEGIRPDALKPYLDALGLESTMQSATFSAAVSAALTTDEQGHTRADARLRNVKLEDGSELIAMQDVQIRGVGTSPSGRTRIDSVELSGPVVSFKREADGGASALGMRIHPHAMAFAARPAPSASDGTTASPTTTPAVSLPRIEVGKLVWKDVKLQFTDEMMQPAKTLALSDAGIELTDFLLDLESKDAGKPGKLKIWLAAPELAEKLSIEGTLTPRPSALAIDLQVSGQGLTSESIAPYVTPLGIEPKLVDGSLQLHFKADVAKPDSDTLTVAMSIEEMRYTDGEEELVGLDKLTIDRATIKSDETRIGQITIDRPRVQVTREEDGALVAAGVRIPPPSTQPSPTPVAASPPTTAPTAPMAATPRVAVFILDALRLTGAEVMWMDHMVSPSVVSTATIDATLDQFTFGREASPATFKVKIASDGVADSMTVAGTIVPSIESPRLTLDVTGRGLRAGPLAAYLPPGIEAPLENGNLKASLEASSDPHPDGGQSVKLIVKGVDYSDGEANLLKLDGVTLDASRVDVPGNVIAINEVSVNGVETDIELTPDGATKLLGLALVPVKPAAPAEDQAPQLAAMPTTAPTADVAQLVEQARRAPPLITLDKLDIELRRATIRGATGADPKTSPISLTDVRLKNIGPMKVGGPDYDQHPPVQISLTGKIDPLVDSFNIDTKVAPLAQQPTLVVDVSVAGIRGEGLTQLLPQLKDQIDGTTLTDGRFHAYLESTARIKKRGPADFDFTRPMELDLVLKDIAFRSAEDGPVLAGLEALDSDGIRIDPKTGAVHVKTLELTKPMGRVMRDQAGIHVLGWVIKLPAKGDQAEPAKDDHANGTQPPAETEFGPAKVASDAAPADSTRAKPPAEMRIDKLLISGLDFTIEDRAVEPAMVVPLTGLDVEVRDLTNLALVEKRPIRFTAVLNAGKVQLPTKIKGAGLPGAIGNMAHIVSGKEVEATPTDVEERELFSQITASGKISLYPQPEGYVKTSVSGLELAALEGEAAAAGVTLTRGVFDSTVDMRLKDDGVIDTRSRLVVTDLQLSEQENGPISRHVKLPGPLGMVIKVLQDADGSITIPMSVSVTDGGIKGVAAAVPGALSSVILTAWGSAGIKVMQGAGSLVGMGAGEKVPDEREPAVIYFAAGNDALEPSDMETINWLIDLMRRDKTVELTLRHQMTTADVERAEIRANPSTSEAAALAQRLRLKKFALLQERAALAAQAKAELASLPADRSDQTIAQLRALDLQIGQTEDALDRLYEMLRPGADRQSPRRTRTAALEIAQQRLRAVKTALVNSGVPDAATRVRMTNPQFAPAEDPAGGRVELTIVTGGRK